jgi:predicted ATPase/signal transduction histidine kinase/tRNA A-37 threonylcarbamoyl transferase component Bud32
VISLPDYTLTDEIHSGVDTVVYRGYRNADRASVAIKLFKSEYPSARQIAKLRHEFAITKDLDLVGVVKAYGLERVGSSLALVTENLEARPLHDVLRTETLDLQTFLQIADSIVNAVESIHLRHVIHKDIKPHNILVDVETRQAKLIDFGIATRLSQETQRAKSPDLLEGTLAYMSPEQTGRMNRITDHRTDLYSLGVTLYEMLTGVLPFRATEPLELVHSHIARKPTPPHELSPAIPEAVSNIVVKLLSKAAEDRYQSAYGLKADLRECAVQLSATGQITTFRLGRHDRSHGLLLPQKLYGREVETATLLAAWGRTNRGAVELVLVSGYAGIGKSALVNELYKVVAGRRAHFIAGKFDQLNRSVPYASLAQAFRDLIRHLCAERAEALALVRSKLVEALGQSGQVLIDLIPEIELVIGRQPSVPELGPAESQNRLNLVFQNFLRVFTTEDHPLVLFLDDLQWADLASLKLLTLLLTDPESTYLLLVGAYRDNEVDAGHPLLAARGDILKAGTKIVDITLEPLRLPDVNQLIADALDCEKQRAAPLAQLVFDKTQGNPFFINQFLVTLYKDQWLTFDAPSGSFRWDLDGIHKAAITDNVVDFMTRKLRRLTPNTQRILMLAACIGHQFDLKTLSTIAEKPPAETAADLWEALGENVVLPLDNDYRFLHPSETQNGAGGLTLKDINVSYRFLHDRVRQAAYALIEDEQKQALHLRIGRLMLAQRDLGERDESLFEVVNHLNRGAAGIAELRERVNLARLNLTAGRRAKAAVAYDVASDYFGAGMSLLGEGGWEQAYELSLAVHTEGAECEYLSGHFERAEALFKDTLTRAKTNVERTRVHALRIVLVSTLAKNDEAVSIARTALALLGIDLPEAEDAAQAAFAAELAAVPVNLSGRRIADLIDAPELTFPEQKAALTILMDVMPAVLSASASLTPLAAIKQANISLKYGHSDASAFGYVMYGLVLAVMGRYAEAQEFGELALALNAKRNNTYLSCRIKGCFAAFINAYRAPLRTSLSLLSQAYPEGLAAGDLQHLSYACLQSMTNRLAHGSELSLIDEEFAKFFPVIQRARDVLSVVQAIIIKQVVENLRGRTKGRHTLNDESFDESELEVRVAQRGYEFDAFWYYLLRTELAFFYEDYESALSMAAEAEPRRPYLASMWFGTEFPLYASLTMLALYPTAKAVEQERYAKELERHKAQIAIWADNCPANFRHKHLLIAAEQARIDGADGEAMKLYEQAIQAAHDNEFPHHEALANELAAKFHLAQGRPKIARVYLADAVYGYARWGAEAKVAQLKEKYAELLPRGAEASSPAGPTETTTITGVAEVLDLATVMKASHAVSGEIELSKLLEKLMRTAMENAGANKGYLLLANKGDLRVEAAADAEEHRISVAQSAPLEDVADLSQAVVRYVQKTRERVVLAHAAEESMFGFDAYMAQKKPKSILCAPIVHQGKLCGILYLENTLIEGAFTPARLEVLQILAAQAAISIENSRLYGTLEEKVRERTAELREVQAKLIRLEREATEKRMAGGFAHEIRNALAGAKLVLARALGQDDVASRASLTLDSANEVGKLHEALTARLSEEELEPLMDRMERIFENQQSLDAALQLVFKATSRALAITKKIMDFSRIAEEGRDGQWVSVNEVIETTLADLRETLDASQISIQANVQGSISILLDETQCFSILQNLLNNARDAILEKEPEGRAGMIEVKAEVLDEACIIRVIDNGVGIRKEDMERIFESFYSTKPEAGTGLGLPVVKKIVDVNGGTIDVQSEWGQGSQFTVTLPIVGASAGKGGSHDEQL